ncbi:MAG: DEAD/DEAH box helicase [Pirellula sp.]|nr:DEAD/DEAH box helicase [Pirellula sp.]
MRQTHKSSSEGRMLRHEVAGETLYLSAERAMWWPARRTLIAADVHLGKAASFRNAGVPIPHGTTRTDLARLTALVEKLRPTTLLIVGDLVHDRRGLTEETVAQIAAWRMRHGELDWLCVTGNHDRKAGNLPAVWSVAPAGDRWKVGPFVFKHHPEPDAGGYVVAGHLHPAVELRGVGKARMKAACFWFGREVAVLPAFGRFTGTSIVRPASGDGVFVVERDEIVQLATTH